MSSVARFTAMFVLLAASVPLSSMAATFQSLYSFTGADDGKYPESSLTIGKKGVLYGSTSGGGANGNTGTLFELQPATGMLTTLHSMSYPADSAAPSGNLILGKKNTLYGTNTGGATNTGSAYKFDIQSQTLTVLHAFTDHDDGGSPVGLVADKNGLLYGTTHFGGSGSNGTIFSLAPATQTLTTLHAFTFAEGGAPLAGLVFDKKGSVYYGTTSMGGSIAEHVYGGGTVFKFEPTSRTVSTLHVFGATPDGAGPTAAPAIGKNGLLYGTTQYGGANCPGFPFSGCGALFKLDPVTHILTTLHSFSTGDDGSHPVGGLVFNKTKAVLYGTTSAGGTGGSGTIFKYDLATETLTTLYAFIGGADGAGPVAALTIDKSGILYGTTVGGGAHGFGTVFKITP